MVSLDNVYGPLGTCDPALVKPPQPDLGTLQVSPTGLVTFEPDPSFYGIMTADKRAIIQVNTADTGMYAFGVFLFTGEKVWTTGDLARSTRVVGLRNSGGGLGTGWSAGTIVIDDSGNGVYTDFLDSAGGTFWPPFVRTVTPEGVTGDPADCTFHGQVATGYNTRTNTYTGRYGIALGIE